MAFMSGLLSAISKSVPYTGVEPVKNVEGYEPSKADSNPEYLGEDKGHKQRPRQPVNTSHSMQKFIGDLEARKQVRDKYSTAEAVQIASCSTPSPNSSVSLRPPQSKGHPSSGMLQVETGSRSRMLANEEMAKSRRIVYKLSIISVLPTKDEETRPNPRGSLPTRSNSDPVLREASKLSNKTDVNKPLKACLKQKARSTNTTPPNGFVTGTISLNETRKLRRVKTVDFEESISEYVPSRPRNSSKTKSYGRSRPDGVLKRAPSCPGRGGLTKRLPACPAVTRTDVHVIAIAPMSTRFSSLDPAQSRQDGESDPATTTMQVVDSSNGSYEVIWDDVPPEHIARTRRHSSSAGQALEALSSTATGSLESVNTKLAEWSGTWDAAFDSFNPTIVVFPDYDGHIPPLECSTVDDEDIKIFAPPNSERTSAVQSQYSSRPVSAPMSRAASQDWLTTPQDRLLNASAFPTEQTLTMPDSDAWSAHLVAARRKLGVPSSERKLSNVDESEMKFRNHRDSVTIAHSRLIRSGVLRPELFAHSDSVSLAKKRMREKNLATAAAHPTCRSKAKSTTEAPKKASPASILRPPESNAT